MKPCTIALSLLLFTATAVAQEKPSKELVDVYNFLIKNVDGKVVQSPLKPFVLEKGKLIGESQNRFRYFDVKLRGTRLSFQVESTSEQTNYKLGPDGKRILPGEKKPERAGTNVIVM